jgi:hypothetical protein
MAMRGHEGRFSSRRKVTLYVDQSPRDRSRYRIVKAVNSINFPMGRKISAEKLQEFIKSGVEVVVLLRK